MTTYKLFELNEKIDEVKKEACLWIESFVANKDQPMVFQNRIRNSHNIFFLLELSKSVNTCYHTDFRPNINRKSLYLFLVDKFNIE